MPVNTMSVVLEWQIFMGTDASLRVSEASGWLAGAGHARTDASIKLRKWGR